MKKTGSNKVTVYDIVTEQIIKALDEGVAVWRKPWNTAGVGMPQRLGSKRPYGSPYYVTWNQIQDAGAKVRQGEKSHIVTALFPKETTNDAGEKYVESFKFRYYRVFNIEQLEVVGNLKVPPVKTREFTPIQTAENVLSAMENKPVVISEGIQAAYYVPSQDVINMPKRETFTSDAAYYSVLFHEMIHWTGHTSRLARLNVETADEDIRNEYAFEELIAEIGAAMLLAHCEIVDAPCRENSVAYLAGWRKALNEDKALIVRAASAAQKAVDFILGHKVATSDETDDAVAVV